MCSTHDKFSVPLDDMICSIYNDFCRFSRNLILFICVQDIGNLRMCSTHDNFSEPSIGLICSTCWVYGQDSAVVWSVRSMVNFWIMYWHVWLITSSPDLLVSDLSDMWWIVEIIYWSDLFDIWSKCKRHLYSVWKQTGLAKITRHLRK